MNDLRYEEFKLDRDHGGIDAAMNLIFHER